MRTQAPVTVRVARRFGASQERTFDAWLDPETAGEWLFATSTGLMLRVEIDARVGGRFVFVDRRGGEDVEHVGEYLMIDRPRRLVFTFSVPKFSLEITRASVEVMPMEAGCELTLTHLPDYANRTAEGWTTILEGLGHALSAKH
jgi:uncharacterized protein YndB with AHSA1/START domain